MVIALILSVSVAIIFAGLFFDERGTVKEYSDENKSQRAEISRLRDTAQVTPGEALVARPPVDDRDIWNLTPDLVADVVKFNGYVPDKKEDAVFFMVQGEHYCVTTDMLPCVAIIKRFNISEDGYDIELIREAARKNPDTKKLQLHTDLRKEVFLWQATVLCE